MLTLNIARIDPINFYRILLIVIKIKNWLYGIPKFLISFFERNFKIFS